MSWSVQEKKKLLMALEQCGGDIIEVQKKLPNRTITEIRQIFDKYTQLANNKMNEEEKLREEDSAINQWIKIFQKAQPKNSLIDILPKALKYIALYEKRPVDEGVNLRDCYLNLADMSNGVVSKTLDPSTNHFFFENLARIAVYMTKTNNFRQKEFVKGIRNVNQIMQPIQSRKTYVRKSSKKRLNAILNPLNVPEDLLKAEKNEPLMECSE